MLDLYFSIPQFVKEASAADLDLNAPEALVMGGFRLDTPAGAWTAKATLMKRAMEDPSYKPEHRLDSKIEEACSLFNIGDEDFQINPVNVDHVLVKHANSGVELFIYNQKDFSDAVDALIQKRASNPYKLCKECAESLIEIGKARGYNLDSETRGKLCKIAGACHADFSRGQQELLKREHLAKVLHMDAEAGILRKLANICAETDKEEIVPYIVECIDEFDRGVGTLKKYASTTDRLPEDAFYLTSEEYIKKDASKCLSVGSYKVAKQTLMKRANVEGITSWAGECGYNIPEYATPEEIAEVLNKMPKSLQKEFANTYLNK